jgi:hypothetical protein
MASTTPKGTLCLQLLKALQVGLPHVHADGPDRPAAAAGQILSKEAVESLTLPFRSGPDRLPGLQVRYHGEALALTPEDLVHSHQPQRSALSPPGPSRKRSLVDPTDGLRREAPLRRHSPNRRVLTVAGHRFREASRVGMLAFEKVDPLSAHPTPRAIDPMDLHHQPHLPGTPRQVPHPAFPHAVRGPDSHPASAARIARFGCRLPNPDRQRRIDLVEPPLVGAIPNQPQNPAYNLLGHPLRGLLSRLPSEAEILRRAGALSSLRPHPRQLRRPTLSGTERQNLSW